MATYILPQVLVFQDFNLASEVDIRDLPACIIGPHAYLLRASDAEEKPSGYLGVYDHEGLFLDGEFKTCYSWPQKPVGSLIDNTYTKLNIDNALLRYYHDTTEDALRTGRNKIRHPFTNFKANGDAYPRSSSLLDRDVTVGDIAVIEYDDGDETKRFATYVKGVEADKIASTIDVATEEDGNQEATSNDTDITAGDDNSGDAVLTVASGAGYSGLADGVASETYTITVTQSSTDGDATTARLRITSASGLDDVADFQPDAVFGDDVTIGTRGLTAKWAGSEFTAGDTWTIAVTGDYAKTEAQSAGTYTGTTDDTYIVEVTTGGDISGGDSPKITVTTAHGTDVSGPTEITALLTALPVGTKGVTISFKTSDQFMKNDRWTIAVTAEANGAYKTLVLGHSLPDAIYTDISGFHEAEDSISESPGDLDTTLNLDLYIKKNIEVGERHVVPGQYNWQQNDTQFCVMAGIQAYDSTWTEDGVPVALDVISDAAVANSNKLYVTYRAWRSDHASAVGTVSSESSLNVIAGPLTPDNELKWAVHKAWLNSNGQPVKYLAITNPNDDAAWSAAVELLEERIDVYGLVPLTTNKTYLDIVESHVNAQSVETIGRWRVMWIQLTNDPVTVIADASTSSDDSEILATTEDDVDTAGTQYTILRITSGNFELEASGVRPGDIVRYQYTADGWGDATYTEYVVDAVLYEDTLRLVTGTPTAESTPRKVEIHRSLTLDEQANNIAASAGNWANRRVRAVWPDVIGRDGATFPGWHLAAALSGLSSGVVPHQGLTNLEISGFDDVTRTTQLFSREQLNTMAAAGVWIVTQDPQTGVVYTRHAVTTADYTDVCRREEVVTRNVDSISFYFLDQFAPYIGISNVTPSMLDIIEAETNAAIQFLRAANFTQLLGGQLIDARITDLRISPVFRDRILLGLDLDLPLPLNNLEIHLLVC